LTPVAADRGWQLLLLSPLLSSARCVRTWLPSLPARIVLHEVMVGYPPQYGTGSAYPIKLGLGLLVPP